QSGEEVEQAVRRISELVERTLEDNAVDFEWSGLRQERIVEKLVDARDTPIAVGRHGRTSPDRPDDSPEQVVLPREPVGSIRATGQRQYWKWQDQHIGPVPPKRPIHKCLWLDTSVSPRMIRIYDKKSKSWSELISYDSSGDRAADVRTLYMLSRPHGWRLESR